MAFIHISRCLQEYNKREWSTVLLVPHSNKGSDKGGAFSLPTCVTCMGILSIRLMSPQFGAPYSLSQYHDFNAKLHMSVDEAICP
ncbi:hypothetical protein TNIN_368291 [Trichonephila inaurata madagascariensis]|uniref:Uncharacterized protein n=1 Tax=Trichonephila inaurata madagascariensis TaxID=2747483 RepID=A0A8X6IFQ1_9ARAC|nr:hypothetical protein TNIN_368291 [Trichonephila inaurata madagascariensis]